MKGQREATKLSHVDQSGLARMVDVSQKGVTTRRAVAESLLRLSRETLTHIARGTLPKGNAVETARIAGIMAAKKTSDLIPLCHPLSLTYADVDAKILRNGVRFRASISSVGPTGVEMEALTASAIAALTLYDMVKAVEKGATIESVRLLEKTGGKSGSYKRA